MKEIFNNLIQNTTFLTVVSGVIVYAISQIILECIINPRKQFKMLRQRIIYAITLYCCYYTNPYNPFKEENVRMKEEYDLASSEMRKIGAELAGYIGTIPKFRKRKIKKLDNVLHALIGISNGFYNVSEKFDTVEANRKCEETIKRELKIN